MMSMLAEPRRKQKWSVDPRNSTWSNDDNKFGQKMLERMGWSKGKGLGRSEQGSTDHIKVKVKNNNFGLGANVSHEDNWIAHQDEFNELLAQLNDHHGQNASNEVPPDDMKSFSLEEKSKTSKKRVHYTKFTKGKDLSSRSETDLNCIFGKRTKSTKEQESSRSQSPVESEESSTCASSELDTESITKTVKSSLSIQEYFAQRMAQLKKAGGPESSSSSVKAEATETSSTAKELIPVHNSDAEEPKRKKKNKKLVQKPEDVEEKCCSPIVLEKKENQEKACSRKKRRKNAETTDNENFCSSSVLELNCEEPRLSKKKKRKRVEKELINGLEQSEEYKVIQGEEDHSAEKFEEKLVTKTSKKKRKKKNQE